MMNTPLHFGQVSDPDESSGQSPGSYISITNQLLSQGKTIEAYNYLESIISIHPQDPLIPIKLGHLSFKLSNLQLAEAWYMLSLQNEEHLDEIWFGLGQVFFSQKSYHKALSAYSTLLHINPRFPYTSLSFLKLGICCLKVKDYQTALNYLEFAFSKADLNKNLMAEGNCYMGIASIALGSNENGFKYFEKAAGFMRNFFTSVCLAWRLLSTEPIKVLLLVKTMLKECQKIGEISDLLLFRALAFIKLKKLNKAKKILSLLVKKFRGNLVYGQYLAIVQVKRGKIEKGLGVMERLKVFWPFHLGLLLNYKKLLAKLGRVLEAETVKMQICGILMIHQCNEYQIMEVVNSTVEELNEPEFILSDCPISESHEYNINPINN